LDSLAAETDERDIERMYAEARRYPLLNAESERDIDGRKWSAVDGLLAAMASDEATRDYLLEWSRNSAMTPIDIAFFDNRDHHFILRREMAVYMAGGKRAQGMESLHRALQRKRSTTFVRRHLDDLELPASLVVGLAAVVLRRHGGSVADSVADALEEWARYWAAATRGDAAPVLEEVTHEALRAHLDTYSRARDTLTMHNLRLVYSIAGRYRGKGVNYLDLVQEGTLGLIRAAEKYDHRKGFRFSTYCFNWITQAIRRHVGDSGGLIRYPTHVQEQVSKLYRLRLAEQARTGEEPGDAALARAAGLSVEKTRDLLQLRNLGISLDAPQFDDEDATLLDTLPGGPFERSEADAENSFLHDRLIAEMNSLERAEREVVVARWGLHDGPPLSRAEIADRMSVSREWVRQLERAALAKLSRNDRIRAAFSDYVDAAD
jgi:RNA polymerase sigma factor (sigma-70 family)